MFSFWSTPAEDNSKAEVVRREGVLCSGKDAFKEHFYVLRGNMLECYADETKEDIKTGVLIDATTTVVALDNTEKKAEESDERGGDEDKQDDDKQDDDKQDDDKQDEDSAASTTLFPFEIRTESTEVVLAATSDNERDDWMTTVQAIVLTEGAVFKSHLRVFSPVTDEFEPKYMLLNGSSLYFGSEECPVDVQIVLTQETILSLNIETFQLILSSPSEGEWMFEAEQVEDIEEWRQHIVQAIQELARDDASSPSSFDPADVLAQGFLDTKYTSRASQWLPLFYVLTNEGMRAYENDASTTLFKFHPFLVDDVVLRTDLDTFSFELLSVSETLHLRVSSLEDMRMWINTMRRAVRTREHASNDLLLQLAREKARHDLFYVVTFNEKQKVGLMLKEAGECAVVRRCSSLKPHFTVTPTILFISILFWLHFTCIRPLFPSLYSYPTPFHT